MADKYAPLTIAGFKHIPDIQGHTQSQGDYGKDEIDGWFLGGKAENAQELARLITQSINAHACSRKQFHPEDPSFINKHSTGYKAAMRSIEENLDNLNTFLSRYATPFYNLRYQGHMLWDTTLPAILGYFSTMLHNPNNVTVQASTAATLLEYMVNVDLCSMVGLDSELEPWSHITSGGTVANLESLWSTRELRLRPLGIKHAIGKDYAEAVGVTVHLPDGTGKRVVDCSNWELINLTVEEILGIPKSIADTCGLEENEVQSNLGNNYSVNALGMVEFTRRYMDGLNQPVYIVPSSKHYSWPKVAYILGMGTEGVMRTIPVDVEARMDLAELQKTIDQCVANKNPILMTVAVFGSTEESAVDPITDILTLRDKYRERNVDFNVHVDAAWGGYHVSSIRKNYRIQWPDMTHIDAPPPYGDTKDPWVDDTSKVCYKPYVIDQMQAIRHCDTVVIDPHKCGYIPYPAGSILYRIGAMRSAINFSAPYIATPEDEVLSMGTYGVEGSKPGAAPAAVFLSHSVIRPSQKGYGKILNACQINTKLFYLYLVALAEQPKYKDRFITVPLQEVPGVCSVDQLGDLSKLSVKKILKKNANLALFRTIGPDQNILNYLFNFKKDDGSPNQDMELVNKLNDRVYDKLHVESGSNVYDYELMITITTFTKESKSYADSSYGKVFVENLAGRLGIINTEDVASIQCHRSVVMNPWIGEFYPEGPNSDNPTNFFGEVIVPKLLDTVCECIDEMIAEGLIET